MEKELTFLEHVRELRQRLVFSIIFFIVIFIIGYIFFPEILIYFNNYIDAGLNVTKLYEGFLMRVNVSFYIGLICTTPVLLLNILVYILPGFEGKNRIVLTSLYILSIALYITAILSVSIFLPITLNFLQSKSFIPDSLNKLFSYSEFLDFFFKFLLAFCLVLQFPIVQLILLYAKVVKISLLVKFIPYFVPISLLFSAIITQDILSQFLVALPLFVLYLLCIGVAKILKWGAEDDPD